jgi:hypothetical protein
MSDLYTLFTEVAALAPEVPDDAILSRTFYKDDRLSAMVFSFAPGQELSEHTAAVPAIHIISGRARLTLGEDATMAEAGTWVHMTPRLPSSCCGRDAGGDAAVDASVRREGTTDYALGICKIVVPSLSWRFAQSPLTCIGSRCFPGIVALLSGIWAGLLRMGWAWPSWSVALAAQAADGSAFLGTVIGIERAIALNHRAAYLRRC